VFVCQSQQVWLENDYLMDGHHALFVVCSSEVNVAASVVYGVGIHIVDVLQKQFVRIYLQEVY